MSHLPCTGPVFRLWSCGYYDMLTSSSAPTLFPNSVVVHEYGDDCLEPNRNRVYISLLDSAKLPKLLLPSRWRTTVYHTILRGYLRDCAVRGFTHAHIFTCPPRRGQSYIFPFKPGYQREISVTRLRQWYEDMLNEAMFRPDPAVLDVMSIAEAFPDTLVTELPYFDGDNWPDMIEETLASQKKTSSGTRAAMAARRLAITGFLLLRAVWEVSAGIRDAE